MHGLRERFVLNRVLTASGTQLDIELQVGGGNVEIWRKSQCVAVFDQGELRAWFSDPAGPHKKGDVTFTLDRRVNRDGGVAVTMTDIHEWTLGADITAQIRNLLN